MTEHRDPEPIYDPPIEHDPIGQALVTLPLALAEGAEEAVVWAASETIIPLGESIIDHFKSPTPASVPVIDLPPDEEDIQMRSTSVSHEDMP